MDGVDVFAVLLMLAFVGAVFSGAGASCIQDRHEAGCKSRCYPYAMVDMTPKDGCVCAFPKEDTASEEKRLSPDSSSSVEE